MDSLPITVAMAGSLDQRVVVDSPAAPASLIMGNA
jgi:hypothetical protein